MFFGNPAKTSGAPGYLSPVDMFGHFDPLFLASWGMPVVDCRVTAVSVYGTGPPLGEPNAIGRFGIYDVSSGIPNTYVLVAVTPTWSWPTLAPAQWWSVGCDIPLVSGNYCLAVISYSSGAVCGSVHFSLKANAITAVTGIAPGTFPNPLGVPSGPTVNNWTMFAEYVYATGGCW